MNDRKPVAILRHEAGHMVVAKVLGFETKELEYRESHAGANLTIAPQLKDIGSVSAYQAMKYAQSRALTRLKLDANFSKPRQVHPTCLNRR